ARGLEPVLARELRELQAGDVEPGRGGVAFRGDQALLYQANLWLRTTIRVLCPVLEAHVESPEQLYAAVQSVDWTRYMTPEHTLAVDCNVRDSHITHSHYAALKTKDAICDQFVEKAGSRPSVDVENPMIALNLHIYRDQAVLSLDSSGESLHKRGYRGKLVKAPLNEALAAGLVYLSDWNDTTPFADPLCGSGTLPIEAAWIALRRPPGLTRRRFGFQGWLNYDIALWTELRDEARRRVGKTLAAPVAASDVRRDAIASARDCAKAAGIGHLVEFAQRDLRDFAPPQQGPGTIICNPPYGERIGEEQDLKALYRLLGEIFRTRCSGWTVCVFTGNPGLARHIGLPATAEVRLFNGKIPCKLIKYQIE
ncbi:MAG TPA: THUMP domain-containing protein, partial [Gemmataceae bacterium]|nr:THUMP domain-containing protein [Gemmataceae bacterium]